MKILKNPVLMFNIVFAITVLTIIGYIALDVPDYQSAPLPLKIGTVIICIGMIYMAVVTWIIPAIKKYLDI